MTSTSTWWRSPLPWLGGLLVVYLLSPLGAFVGRLTTTAHPASPGTGRALLVSAETATIATAVIAVLGVPLAYVLSRGRGRRSSLLGVAVQLPIALPPLMSGILLLYLVGPYTTIGRLFGGRLTDNRVGIVLAQIFVAAPFLVVSARAAFVQLDPALDEVAATLGHRRLARFCRVAVPAALPGITAGLLLAWLRAFGEFGATVILAYHPYSLPVFTYVQFGSGGLDRTLLPVAAALGAAVVVLGLSVAVSGRRLRGPRHLRGAQRHPPAAAHQPAAAASEPLTFDVSGAAGDFHVHAAAGPVRALAIIGATGAGKTLTLRALAGLLGPGRGSVRLGARELGTLAPEARNVGYVPQESTLLAHAPVWRQVGFGADSDPQVAAYWLDWFALTPLADRLPAELSGGQRRKTAIARALAREPDLLLLDEPFSGLDTFSRNDLRDDLRRLRREAGLTTVIVTHDPDDVAMLADEVLVLDRGRPLQQGPLEEVYAAPRGPAVARLLGIPNAIAVAIVDGSTVRCADGVVLPAGSHALRRGSQATVVIDPARVVLNRRGGVAATVLDVVRHPDRCEVMVSLGASTTLRVSQRAEAARPSIGARVSVRIDPSGVRVVPHSGSAP